MTLASFWKEVHKLRDRIGLDRFVHGPIPEVDLTRFPPEDHVANHAAETEAERIAVIERVTGRPWIEPEVPPGWRGTPPMTSIVVDLCATCREGG